MFRASGRPLSAAVNLPHASGDVPAARGTVHNATESSPREWGCSAEKAGCACRQRIFPTRVGMFRRRAVRIIIDLDLPHASGDVPFPRCTPKSLSPSSPREWGCSGGENVLLEISAIFPTRVGMFRINGVVHQLPVDLPHASGDVPLNPCGEPQMKISSPREWGCSALDVRAVADCAIFPTRVGMFRSSGSPWRPPGDLPHASGDVPSERYLVMRSRISSPREWGCSGRGCTARDRGPIFPTRVGMFRQPVSTLPSAVYLPHASGDVPGMYLWLLPAASSSPREWGCSE